MTNSKDETDEFIEQLRDEDSVIAKIEQIWTKANKSDPASMLDAIDEISTYLNIVYGEHADIHTSHSGRYLTIDIITK